MYILHMLTLQGCHVLSHQANNASHCSHTCDRQIVGFLSVRLGIGKHAQQNASQLFV